MHYFFKLFNSEFSGSASIYLEGMQSAALHGIFNKPKLVAANVMALVIRKEGTVH